MADLQAFRRELDVFLEQATSIEGRREIFVGIALEEITRFESQWREALGEDPQTEVFVDGVEGAPIEAVTIPGGTVAARVIPLGPVVDRALELFDLLTKVVTGDYKTQTAVFVNDVRGSAATATAGDQVAIVNLAPFARKAEIRSFNDADNSGFRNGLFEGVAALLRREVRGVAVPVRYVWRSFGGQRLPALLIG